jgi:hypothetical protein
MDNEEDVLVGGGTARGLQVWARRILRCCGSLGLKRAVQRRSRLQDEHLAEHPGPKIVFYGSDEFALWKDLEVDLGAHDALLPPIKGALNCGIEGATTSDLSYHAFELMARHNPATMVISVGSADYDAEWIRSHEFIIERCMIDLKDIIDTAYNFGTRDVRLLIVPDPPGFSQDKCEFMSLLTTRLVELTRENGWYHLRLELLDIRELLGRDVDRMQDAYEGDEIRPSAYAHQLKGDVLRDLLGPDGQFPLGRPYPQVCVTDDLSLGDNEDDRLLIST